MQAPTYVIERYHVDADERWTHHIAYETRDHAERRTHQMNEKGNPHGRYYRLVLNGEVIA